MRSRRKRYYHKTIVARNIFGSASVFAAAVCLAAALMVAVGGRFLPPISSTALRSCFAVVSGRGGAAFKTPSVSQRLWNLFPVIPATEAYQKTLWAEQGGVKKPDGFASEEQENREAQESQVQVRSIDMSAEGISFRNETGYTPQASAYIDRPLSFTRGQAEPQVLILHTHTSEAYIESPGARTEDNTKNVVQVGATVAQALKEQGISVIHDQTRNDYPSYNGSYSKALSGIQAWRKKHPTIEIVLDIHRDYAEQTKDGETFQLKPVCQVEGEAVAQVMLVVGTDGLGLTHPDWKENLAFAVQLHKAMCDMAPKIARPINLRRERFNQHMTKGSLIVEVGTAGNSVAECERAAVYIGKAVAAVLKGLPE